MRLVDYNKDPIGEYMRRVRVAESGGSDSAKSKTSSATGRYQFTSGTWKQAERALGRKLNIYDGNDQDDAMRWLTNENAKTLKSIGVEVNPTNLYMAHFLGQNGVKRFFNAYNVNPNAPVTSFTTEAEYKANKSLFSKGDTLSKFYAIMGRKVGRTSMDKQTNFSDYPSSSYKPSIPTFSDNIDNNYMVDSQPLYAESNQLQYSGQTLQNDINQFINGINEQDENIRSLINKDKDMLALDEKNRERAFIEEIMNGYLDVPIIEKRVRKI